MTNDPRDSQGGSQFLRAIRRRFLVVVLCALAVPAAAVAYSLSQQKEYSTSASLLFRDPQFDQKLFGSAIISAQSDPTREAATNVALVSLDVVADRTAKRIGGGVTGSEIKGHISVAENGQSDVVSIAASDPVPRRAALIANTFAQEYINFRRSADRSKIAQARTLVQSQVNSLTAPKDSAARRSLVQRAEQLDVLASLQTGNAELVQPAGVPGSPSSPKPMRNGILGAVVGLLLGLGLAVLFERLDRRLKDSHEIGEAFDRPILGAIPQSRAIAQADRFGADLAPGEAEAFRMLRANLRYFNVDQEIRSVLITSSAPGDGKSTVSLQLAATTAAAGARVLLLEADLRHPTLAGRLGLPLARGLSQVLAGDLALSEATATVQVGGGANGRSMDVLVSGPIPPNPTDLIESERMHSIIRSAEEDYDLVIVDTPPTSVVSDAIPLLNQVTGVIVVCRLGKTTRESAGRLRQQLEQLKANLLGLVVNSVGRERGYGYGYGYGYGAQGRRKTDAPRLGDADSTTVKPGPQASWRREVNGNGRQPEEQDEPASVGAQGAGPAAARRTPPPPGSAPVPPQRPSRPGILRRKRRRRATD